MKKISYAQLQEKYPKQIVALDRDETHVVASGSAFDEIFQVLKKKSVNPKDVVFIGPVQEKGMINVYVSVRDQAY